VTTDDDSRGSIAGSASDRGADRGRSRAMDIELPRVGVGTDVHSIEAGRACRLAGLDWPGADGCAGHSDGDVVAHALTDAVLSAAGLGDIGGLLGTDDPRWAGARGVAVLEHVRAVLAAAGWRVGNASVQLVAST